MKKRSEKVYNKGNMKMEVEVDKRRNGKEQYY